MKFDLDCFVLAQVRGDAKNAADVPAVTIHGFFNSPDAALATLPELKKTLAAQWVEGINNFMGVKGFVEWNESQYDAGKFYVFTLTGLKFSSFFELEESVEAAALNQWRNIKPISPA